MDEFDFTNDYGGFLSFDDDCCLFSPGDSGSLIIEPDFPDFNDED